MKWISRFVPTVIFIVLASVYIYPIFLGLILLPLDLLVSNSNPWLYASTILLKNSYMQDSIIQMFPWKHLTFASLTSGVIPLWNPYQFMGMPFMAGMKPLVFYPANILFIFGEVRAWNLLLWSQLFLSLVFMYLFLRSLRVGNLSALFSSIAFAFSSLMICVLEFGSEGHVLLWLPLLLFIVKRFLDTDKKVYLVGFTVAIACSIFAGQFQYFAYGGILVIAFSIYEAVLLHKMNRLVWIVGAGLFGVGISAIQLIPGIELYTYSYRGMTDGYAMFVNGLLKPFHLLRLISPDWFGNPITNDLRIGYIEQSGYFGVIPLFFTLYAIIYGRKNLYIRFFSLSMVLATIFSMDGAAQIFYFLKIPIITSGYGGRLFSIALLSGAVLSGFGLSEFISTKNRRHQLTALFIFVGIISLCILVGFIGNVLHLSSFVRFSNIRYQVFFVIFFVLLTTMYLHVQKNKFIRIIFLLCVIGITYFDLFRMGYRFLTFSNTKFLYPEIPVISYIKRETTNNLGRVYGITEPEIHTYFGLYSIETYNPMYPLRTAQFLQALEGTSGKQLANKYQVTGSERIKYALDFLGINFLTTPKGMNPGATYFKSVKYEKDLEKVYEDEGNDVYINVTAYPRFNLYYDIKDGVSDNDALVAIANGVYDFRNTLLIKEKLYSKIPPGSGNVSLVSSGVNFQKFHASTTSPAVFYISDSHFPGWHATVNGKDIPILTANYNFRAVEVPAGESSIEFWYFPKSFEFGLWISGVSLLLFVSLSVFICISNNRWNQRK